jgi:tight adherence protein B
MPAHVGMYLLLLVGIYFAARLGVTVCRIVGYEYRQSYLRQQKRQLADLFVAITPERILIITLAVALVLGGLVYWLLQNLILVALILAVALFVPGWVKNYLRNKRFTQFEEQFPEALGLLSNSMRAGLALPHAISKVSEEMEPPVSQEFGLLTRELQMGKAERAYYGMAERVPLESVRLFVTSVVTCQKMGGNLAEMSDRISATIRSNIELRRELRVMTAEGRFQGMMMCAMPFFVAGVLFYVNPEIVMPLIETTLGHMLIVAVVMLEVIGWLVIREILKIEE